MLVSNVICYVALEHRRRSAHLKVLSAIFETRKDLCRDGIFRSYSESRTG